METRSNSLEIRATNDAIRGIAAVFYDGTPNTEYPLWKGTVERIDERAFDNAINKQADVRALFNHDANWLLGRTSNQTLTLRKDDTGLRYSIPYDANDEQHRTI